MFSVFGFTTHASYIDIDGETVTFHFGTANESVPLTNIKSVVQRTWPFFFGLGPKLGPDGGVAYVGSTDGVLQIWFKKPVSLNVWGLFGHSTATCVTVSVEDPQGFKDAIEEKLAAL
jgi:hypothetical protein